MTKAKMTSPLTRKAVLASVNISMWTARKLDKKVTKETNKRHGASDDAGRYNKLLIESVHLSRINKIVSATREMHHTMTRPWADSGLRILPNTLHIEFANKFREAQREFNRAVAEFCNGYPAFVEERKVKLNGMFDPADYPAPDQIRSKFAFEMEIMPVPDAGDFRSELDDEVVEDIREQIEASTERAIDGAMKATIADIVDVVGTMSTKLAEFGKVKDGQKKASHFHDSLVTNVRDLAKLLPAFNLTNDPKLDKIAKRIVKELCVEEPTELRENEKARESVRKSADEIVKAVEGFLA